MRARRIELVMDTAHYPYIVASEQDAAARYLGAHFHARTLLHRAGVWELGWVQTSQRSSVAIP
jgi:hypothetical protein